MLLIVSFYLFIYLHKYLYKVALAIPCIFTNCKAIIFLYSDILDFSYALI